jgi:hypothetical protein
MEEKLFKAFITRYHHMRVLNIAITLRQLTQVIIILKYNIAIALKRMIMKVVLFHMRIMRSGLLRGMEGIIRVWLI